MAVFNFEIKRQSYEIALKQTKDALCAGDVERGKYFLSRAIELSAQLVENCIVDRMRENYAAENRKLLALSSSLDRGVNPFNKSAAAPAASAAPSGSSVPSKGGASGSAGKGVNSASGKGAGSGSGAKPSQAAAEKKENGEFFSSEAPKTTLDDVAGLEDVKRQIRLRVIAPMKQPELYNKYMDDAGCQILMYGPPGCGKSFVAEAIAGELKCAYAILNASDLLDKYVGEGSKKVTRIFKEAEQYKNCLIFFDELDAVFASRESDDSKYTKDVLTTFLTCLSGFHADESGGIKVIIGATNRPWALDSALIRGKRFDTHIYVGLPDADARAFLVHKAFRKTPSLLEGSDLTEQDLVEMFEGYSCADISSMLVKMKTRAFERALDKFSDEESADEPVTKEDATEVVASYRNSVTPESLQAFKAFENGEI
ncbi:MAG: ATP-binding protein [Candidatus Coproplasma sp.]